jgi:hypothetical protein
LIRWGDLIRTGDRATVGTVEEGHMRAVVAASISALMFLALGVADTAAATCLKLTVTIVGTSSDDSIVGTPGPDVI